MSQELRLAVFGGVLPGMLTGITMLAAWVLWARKRDRDTRSAANIPDSIRSRVAPGPVWVAPLVLAIGYLGADFATNGLMTLWPDSNSYRFPHVALLLGLVGVIESLVPGLAIGRTILVTLLRAAALAGGFWLLVEGYHESGSVSDATFYGSMALVTIGGSWVIALADLGAGAASARVVGPIVALIGAACVPLLLSAGYALVAQSSAVFVAWGVAVSLVAWIVWLYARRRGMAENARIVRLDRGGMTVFAGLVILHAVGTRFHTYPAPHGPTGLLLLAMAPAMLAVLGLRGATDAPREQPWRAGRAQIALTLAAVLATLGAATVPILLDQPPADPASGYDEYSAP